MVKSWVAGWIIGIAIASFVDDALSDTLPSYGTMIPLAGDDHRHAGSAASHLKLARGVCSDIGLGNPHERGLNIAVYDAMRNAGYDWANIAYHDYAISVGSTNLTYLDWIGPGPARAVDPTFGYQVIPSTKGFPNWTQCGDGGPAYQPCSGSTGANEALSHSTAADLRNEPGHFAAFSGREYTNAAEPHTIAIPTGDTDTVCGIGVYTAASPPDQTAGLPPADKCSSESDLYAWIHRSQADHGGGDGVLIRAHPEDPTFASGENWHPVYRPFGFSDRSIYGMEVGKLYGIGPQWEGTFQKYLAKGNRLFPSYGSDAHTLHATTPGCSGNELPFLDSGATICWVDAPAATWDRPDLIDAMRERRCYYSSAFKPRLEVEACGEASGSTCVPMGGQIDAANGRIRVKVRAKNDLRSQAGNAVVYRRFDRVEIVNQQGNVLDSCTSCCSRNASTGDVCAIDFPVVSLSSAGGAAYVRICGGSSSCGSDADSTSVVSAPVFVNWDGFRASAGQPSSELFDGDGDGVEAPYDNCIAQPNADQHNFDHDTLGDRCDSDCRASAVDPDGDGVYACSKCDADGADVDSDGIPDACDNCPTVANGQAQALLAGLGNQRDRDHDGIGDACDNCVYDPNREAIPVPGRTTTGGQRDDDADGYGNACDPDFDNDGVVTANAFDELQSSNGKQVTTDTCGSSGNLPCERFDFDGGGLEINACALDCPDSYALRRLIIDPLTHSFLANFRLGPKCPDCGASFDALRCEGDACDPDADGVNSSSDNCPFNSNPLQADADGDKVGDACDNCTNVSNPRVTPGFLAANPWAALTGGQRDDDHDGFGNKCDAKFPGERGANVNSKDREEFLAAMGKSRMADACGTDGSQPCSTFDLDERSVESINVADAARFKLLTGSPPGPKCSICPLACVAGTDASCASTP
jgi:hypothetical protein